MWNKIKQSKAYQIIQETITLYGENGVSLFGAALAYYTLFSIAPLILFAVIVAANFYNEETVQGVVDSRLREFFGINGAAAVQSLMTSLQNSPKTQNGFVWIGTLTLLFGASKLFVQMKTALNRIWHAEKPRKGVKVFLFNKIVAIVSVISFAGLLVLSMILGTVLSRMTGFVSTYVPATVFLWQYVDAAVSVLLLAIVFSAIYRILPDKKVDWKSSWIGGWFSAALFTIGKFGFSYYLAKGGMSSGYGAASSFTILLVWIYYSAQIFFLGAQLAEVVSRRSLL